MKPKFAAGHAPCLVWQQRWCLNTCQGQEQLRSLRQDALLGAGAAGLHWLRRCGRSRRVCWCYQCPGLYSHRKGHAGCREQVLGQGTCPAETFANSWERHGACGRQSSGVRLSHSSEAQRSHVTQLPESCRPPARPSQLCSLPWTDRHHRAAQTLPDLVLPGAGGEGGTSRPAAWWGGT